MFARGLFVVLILVGQVPLRFCTCGSVHLHAAQPAAPEQAPDETRQVDTESESHHDDDCQALKPRPSFHSALVASVEPGSMDCLDLGECLVSAPQPLHPKHETAASPFRPPGIPPVPLFITLLVLRN